MEFIVSDDWRQAFPGAVAGTLVMEGVANPAEHQALRQHVRSLEADIRQRFGGPDAARLMAADPILEAYRAYYRRFGKTYHVQLQLESTALKGRPLARSGALVEAMFAAEVKNRLLTAGHDLDAVDGTVTLDVSRGGERYVTLAGREQKLKPGDMLMRDETAIISCVLYGRTGGRGWGKPPGGRCSRCTPRRGSAPQPCCATWGTSPLTCAWPPPRQQR